MEAVVIPITATLRAVDPEAPGAPLKAAPVSVVITESGDPDRGNGMRVELFLEDLVITAVCGGSTMTLGLPINMLLEEIGELTRAHQS